MRSHRISSTGVAKDWTATDARTPAAHAERPLHRARRPEPGLRSGVGRPLGRPHLGHLVWRSAPQRAVPLVTESFDWVHGVFLGSIVASETTAAATGAVGTLRRDPFRHAPVLRVQHGRLLRSLAAHRGVDLFGQAAPDLLRELVPKGRGGPLPVAWLRREFPGARLDLRARGRSRRGAGDPDRPGARPGAIDTEGLGVSKDAMEELLGVDAEDWRTEVPRIREYYEGFGDRLPDELAAQVDELEKRLG